MIPWPGNVRELQNLVHSLVITLTGPLISPRDLPPQISGATREPSCYSEDILAARRPLRDIMGVRSLTSTPSMASTSPQASR